MENEEKFSVDTQNLKTETKETVNQVKESIKNVNLKNDAEETKGFLKVPVLSPRTGRAFWRAHSPPRRREARLQPQRVR